MTDYTDLLRRLRETHCDTCDIRLMEYGDFACSCGHDAAADAIERERAAADMIAEERDAWEKRAKADNAALRDALQHIAEPLAWELDHLEPGYKINAPMMISILDQPSYYREIARAALLAGKEKP